MNLDLLTPAPLHNGSFIKECLRPSEQISAQRILIVEDDPILSWLISGILEKDDFAVEAASGGQQAWEALHHDLYDLLVTDNEMPQLTGIELIRRIRKAGMSLPVIIASGSFSVQSVRDYPQLQIAAVIPKPFGKCEFLDTVRNVLSVYRNTSTETRSLNRSRNVSK
jgi:DNA-binding NtrC family response regulator